MDSSNKSHGASSRRSKSSYSDLLKMENIDGIISNYEEFDCPICFVPIEIGQGVVLRNCLHSFCKICINLSIIMGEPGNIKCPFMDNNYACNDLLQDREIRCLLTDAEYDDYLMKTLLLAENNASGTFHCKTPNCIGWVFVDNQVEIFNCPKCNGTNCIPCQAIHPGITCQQYKIQLSASEEHKKSSEMVQTLIDKGKAMRCPTCQIVITKPDGCDYVRCTMCKTGICWVTKGPRWGPGGENDNTGGCKCKINNRKCHPNCRNCH